MPHVAKTFLAKRALELVLGQLSETPLVHLVPTPEEDTLLLGTEHVILLADRTLLPQCIRHVSVLTELGFVNACLTLMAVLKVLATALLANPALVTMKILLLNPVRVVKNALRAKILSKESFAKFAANRRLQNVSES